MIWEPDRRCVKDDLASVRFSVSQGKAECMLAHAKRVQNPHARFQIVKLRLDDLSMPRRLGGAFVDESGHLAVGPGSGEIDGSEFCMRKKMQMNFAGGGHEVELDPYNIDEAWGHTTIRKDDAGIITMTTCKASEAEANGGECFKPKYKDCKDCEFGERGPDKEYACWCNEDPNQTQLNIYGSGGCAEGAIASGLYSPTFGTASAATKLPRVHGRSSHLGRGRKRTKL